MLRKAVDAEVVAQPSPPRPPVRVRRETSTFRVAAPSVPSARPRWLGALRLLAAVSPWGWAWLVYLLAFAMSTMGGTARRLLVFAAPRLAVVTVLAVVACSYWQALRRRRRI